MSTVTDLADVIGKQALDESLKNAGGATFYRVAKQAAIAAGKPPPGPDDDIGLGRIDFKISDTLRSDTVRAHLYAPRVYKDAPELFFGPFLQIGTFLKESGAPIGSGTATLLDIAGDPTTYFLPGTGGLFRGGLKYAVPRVVSRLLEGGAKGVTGEALVHAAATELESIGKIVGAREALVTAAKAGDKKAIKEIGIAALKSGEIPAEFAEGAKSLRRDAKALGIILTNSEKISKIEKLGAKDFLQDTLRARLDAKQISFGGFVIPDNPFKHPLAFGRQIIGLSHEGDRFFFPAADAVAAGLDKVGAERFLRPSEFKAPIESLNITSALRKGDEAVGAITGGVFKESRLKPYQVGITHEALLAVNSAPSARLPSVIGYDAITDKEFRELHRVYLGADSTKRVSEESFVTFREEVLKGLNGAREGLDRAAAQRTQAALDSMTAKIRDIGQQAVDAGALDLADVDLLQSQGRRIFNTLRDVQDLKYESASLGQALAGRVNLGTLLSHVLNTGMADIFEGAYGKRGPRELARSALSDAIEHPEWFAKGQDGRLRLVAEGDAIGKDTFLAKVLETSRGNKATAGLETHLRTEGFAPDITQLSEQMRRGFDAVGSNLVHEGIVPGVIAGYLPHTFRPNDRFYKEFKLYHGQEGAFVEDLLGQKVTGDARIAAFLNGKDIAPEVEKLRQGKASFQEARRLTEKLAVELEGAGYGKYERDAVNLYTGYMDSVNRAMLFNRLASDPAALAPLLTVEQIAAEMGADAAKGHTNEWLAKHNIRRSMFKEDVPREAQHLFVEVTGRPRSQLLRDQPLGLAEAVTQQAVRAREGLNAGAKGTVELRQALGDVLHGKTELRLEKKLDGSNAVLKFTDKEGNKVPFDSSWAALDSYPKALKNRNSIKTAVNRRLAEAQREATKEIAERVAAGSVAREGRSSKTLSVFAPDHGHIAEAFRLFNRNKYDSDLMRAIDRWNYKLKSVKLSLDIFHYNVLALTTFSQDPLRLLAYLKDDAGKLLPGVAEGAFLKRAGEATVLKKAAIGGAAGAGLAAATGNEDDIATYSAAGALYGGILAAAKRSALRGYKMLLSPENVDTLLWAGLGGWSGRPDDRAIGVLQTGLRALTEALQKDPKAAGALIHPIDGTRHIIDAFDHQLWGILHNGSKHYYFATRWARELPKLEASTAFKAADEAGQHLLKLDLAKQLVQAGNTAFGGLTWRNILAKPETQHLLRQGLLSPDWTVARLAGASAVALNLRLPQRVALGAALGTAVDFLQYGGDEDAPRWRGPILGGLMGAGLGAFADTIAKRMGTKGDILAKESRRLYSSAIIGGLLTMEALNLALSGHHLWENPEDKRTSVDLGDGSFLALGKPYVEVLEFAGILEPKKYTVPVFSRLKAKGAALPLTAINLLTNSDGFGPLLTPEDYVFTADAKHSAPIKLGAFAADVVLPIGVTGPTRLAGEALGGKAGGPEVRRALLRTAGFTTSSIPGLEAQRAPRLNFQIPVAPIPLPTLGNPRNLLEQSFR